MTELTIILGSIISAFALGIMGSSHCMGMCGGISAALGFQQSKADGRIISFNLGRIFTYTLIGAVAGLLGEEISAFSPLLGPVLRTLAGILLIMMGFYIAGWWTALTQLEKIGSYLWRYIQPISAKLLPIHNHSQAIRLGILWGLLPCGLVYSTLSWALATAQWQYSALLMLAFGLGTLPSMLVSGYLGTKVLVFLKTGKTRTIAALLMILLGLMTAVPPWLHGSHHNHSVNSANEQPMDHATHHH